MKNFKWICDVVHSFGVYVWCVCVPSIPTLYSIYDAYMYCIEKAIDALPKNIYSDVPRTAHTEKLLYTAFLSGLYLRRKAFRNEFRAPQRPDQI